MRRALLILACATSTPAAAQDMELASASGLRLDRRAAADTAAPEVVTAPALIARGVRGTFHVVEIPVPAVFARLAGVRYEVQPDGTSPLLSRRSGVVEPGGDAPGRLGTVLLTFSVPKRARAGAVPVARVQFTAPGLTPVEVPVLVAIDPTQAIELSVGDQLRGVRPGDRFTLSYRVMNLGNAPEAVQVQAIVPSGWEVLAGQGAPVSLGVNGMEERTFTVSVPLGSATGSAMIRLVALAAGRPVAGTEVRLEVLDVHRLSSAGSLLTTSIGVGSGPGQAGATVMSASLEGYLAPDIRVSARVSGPVSGQDQGSYSLSRLGMYRAAPTVMLAGRQWGLTLGTGSGQFSELTGLSFSHQGVAGSVAGRSWSGAIVAGRPERYGTTAPRNGEFLGARLGWTNGGVSVTGTATHLADPRGIERRLDALSLATALPGVLEGTLSAELARRQSDAASGMGWSAGYQRRSARDNLSLRVVHAPGGSRAFARASDEVSASLSRMVTRQLSVHGSYWSSADNAAVSFSRIASEGWSVGSQFQLSGAVNLGVAGRRSAFSAAGAAGAFGTTDNGVVGSLSARRGRWFGTVMGSVGATTRFTAVAGGGALHEAGASRGAQGSIGIGLGGGTLELAARYDRNDPHSGRIPETGELSLRADRMPLLIRNQTRILAGGTLRRSFYPGFGPARTIITSDLAVEFPGGFGIGISAERNPFLAGAGTSGWLMALRLDRRTALPALAHAATRGSAFIDRNGNGERDAGEPGFAGAIVRRGMTSAVTDRDGAFELPGLEPEAVAVDPLSLPHGWILGPSHRSRNRYLFAVVAVEPVEVILTIASGEHGRVGADDLAPVIVLVRHESGKVWVSRKDGANRAVFDALPPGRYTVELDLADLKEPMEQVNRPVFQVEGGAVTTPRVEVVLRPRPVAVKRLDQGGKP